MDIIAAWAAPTGNHILIISSVANVGINLAAARIMILLVRRS
jgi:hypothetical protein